MERLGWESVHSEIDVLSDLYDADIRLSHIRIDLHLREIICDLKNHRRLQTGGNSLANIDAARDHYAVDRGSDRAVLKIGLHFVQRTLLDFHIGLALMQIRHRLIEVRLRRRFSGEEVLSALRVQPCQLEPSLCAGDVAFGLSHRGLEKRRVNLRHHLAGFDL